MTLVLLLPNRQAEVGTRVDTMDALPALGREEGDDVVAHRQRGDAPADRLDNAGALVAEHGRRIAGRVGAGGGVEVRMTDAASVQANQHLPAPRLRQLDLLHRQRLTELFQHSCTHLHRAKLLPQSAIVSSTGCGISNHRTPGQNCRG
jgi:hypothetical protein